MSKTPTEKKFSQRNKPYVMPVSSQRENTPPKENESQGSLQGSSHGPSQGSSQGSSQESVVLSPRAQHGRFLGYGEFEKGAVEETYDTFIKF